MITIVRASHSVSENHCNVPVKHNSAPFVTFKRQLLNMNKSLMNIWFLCRVCGLIALGGVLRQSVARWGSINAAMLLLLCCFLTVIERRSHSSPCMLHQSCSRSLTNISCLINQYLQLYFTNAVLKRQ